MSTAKDIIRRALRLLGELSAGQQPSGHNASDGVEQLQSLILSLPGLLLNGRWHDHATSSAYTACEAARVTVTSPGVVTLPTALSYGGFTRPPRDLAKVQILGTATNAGLWIYSATKAAWTQADALTINSECPFGTEDDAGLAAQLAVNWQDDFGDTAALGQRTLALAAQSARSFRARFKKNEACMSERYVGLHYDSEWADWSTEGDIGDVADLFEDELDFPI